ncbi:MAG: M28 family peptidase [Chitinophagaceae bacterium]|nr:MAG: M28 family peptidase [Chitinophagaceae bacterium]
MKSQILLACAVGISSLHAQSTNQKVFQQINKEVLANSVAYQKLDESGKKIGHRLTGSENGKKAEQFAFDLFKLYGFNDVKFQPFEVESWARGTVKFTLTDAATKTASEIKCVALAHSPVKVDETAELVDMGNGLEADYTANPEKAKGKIVFAALSLLPDSKGLSNLHRSEKTALAIKYGAKGVILFNGVKGGVLLTGTASVTGKLNPIPAICISLEEGMRIKDLLAKGGYSGKIQMSNFSGPIKARNVVATVPGKKFPNEKIVVCGHLDSWDLATGAADNGIGSFSIIDMARTFKKLKLQTDRTVEFVLFMGEEQGLLGSRSYVEEAKKTNTLKNVAYVFNFDMAGNAAGFTAGGRKEAETYFKAVGEDIKAVDTSFANRGGAGRAGMHSDHQPFMLEGVPTASSSGALSADIGRCYHADCDLIDIIDKKWMVNQVRFSSMMIYAIANAPELPAKHQSDAEVKQFMLDNNLKEALTIAGDWRWEK